MSTPNIPIGSNFLTDPFIGPAIGIDTARTLYHAAMMYDGIHVDEHRENMLFSLGEIGLLMGEYYGMRAYVDTSLDNPTDTKATGILVSVLLFVNGPIIFKSYYQYKGFLPRTSKIVDAIANASIIALLFSRQIISTQMITNVSACNSKNKASADCPAPSPIKPYSFNFLSPFS
jgi:hypothetical protein